MWHVSMLYWNTEMRPLKFLLPSTKTIIWKKDVGLAWCYPELINSYCLTLSPPNCLVIIIFSLKCSSKVLHTLQRSHLKVWAWQTYFSSFFNPNCWIFTFADCTESPLCAELKKALCCVCFHMPALPGSESTQAQHCECTNQLELLIHSTQLVSFPKDDISVLINNLGTESSLVFAQTIDSLIPASLLLTRSGPAYFFFLLFPK